MGRFYCESKYRLRPWEEAMRQARWYFVSRASERRYLEERAEEMHLQGWETVYLPHGKTGWSLWTRRKASA